MNNSYYRRFLTLFLLPAVSTTPSALAAEQNDEDTSQPLVIRDFLPREGRWGLNIGYSYANSTSIDTVSNTQVNQTNADALSLSATVRYGHSRKTEIYTSVSFLASQTRTADSTGTSTDSASRFAGLTVGISHELIKEGPTPSLYGGITVSAVENVGTTHQELEYGKSFGLSLTSYRIYDPTVMSGSVSMNVALPRQVNGRNIDPGDSLVTGIGISFIPNSDSSINASVGWSYTDRSTIDGVKQGIARTTTRLNLGYGYEWSRTTYVFVSVGNVISGEGGASSALSTNYRF